MSKLFLSFSSRTDMNIAKDILSNVGYNGKVCQKRHYVLEFEIKPLQEINILKTLDSYQIWADAYDSFEEYLNQS